MESINILGITGVAAIVVICLMIGMIVKATGINNKWIPCICGVFGGICGVLAMIGGMPDFPAHDYFTAVAIGIVSGLGSVGCHQVVKQLMNGAAPDADVDYKAGYYNILDEYKRYRDEHEPVEEDNNEEVENNG